MTDRRGPYLIFMLLVSTLSLVILGVTALSGLTAQQKSVLALADDAICVLFFFDFLVSLYRAPDRAAYFFRWGWLDLLSSVPMVDALRLGRLARIVRIVRVLRGIRASRVFAQFLFARRAQSAFLGVALLSLLLVVTSSIAILQFEQPPVSNIASAEDAVWWSITTMTTVGYGDRYPVTTEGRAIAAFLMVCGVGLFGALSGFVASWIMKPEQQQQESEIAELLAEVQALRREMAARAEAP